MAAGTVEATRSAVIEAPHRTAAEEELFRLASEMTGAFGALCFAGGTLNVYSQIGLVTLD